MAIAFNYLAEELRKDFESILSRHGLLFRVFARGKSKDSLRLKMEINPGKYSIGGKLIQDAIGIRVVLYFIEDISIVAEIVKNNFDIDYGGTTIDSPKEDTFNVQRHNIIARIPALLNDDFKRESAKEPIDSTFEIQLRTVLSEGWHEVDHDLRYKNASAWTFQEDVSRTFNGILATLETSDWGMQQIFDELAYRHYKAANWTHMLACKLRLRIKPELDPRLVAVINSDPTISKELFRIDKFKLIQSFSIVSSLLPTNLDNFIFVWNYFGPKNKRITESTPSLIISFLDDIN